jgi:hypothetical protein
MVEKFFWIILGVSLVILGFGVINSPIFFDRRHGIWQDFTGINIPLGICFVVIGLIAIWATARSILKTRGK